MANNRLPKYLLVRLERAGLISPAQIQIALQDQIQYNHLELEEILTLRGWLKPETIDFFSEKIIKLINCSKKITLIKCLQLAGLLTNEEIKKIVTIQKETGIVLDCLLVNLGYIKQSTIEFFKKYLVSNQLETQISPKISKISILTEQKEYKKSTSSLTKTTYFKDKTAQKIVQNLEFIDPKTTSNLKISLPRDSFILSLRLNQAGLLSEAQIEIALRDRSQNRNFTLEEIIILRGWLKQETLAFFLGKFPKLINQPKTLSLTECLDQAGLLSKKNIANILRSQQEKGQNFHALVVELGYVKQSTLDFFLNYLVDKDLVDLSWKKSPTQPKTIVARTSLLELKKNTSSNYTIKSNDFEGNSHSNSDSWSEAKTIIGAGPLYI